MILREEGPEGQVIYVRWRLAEVMMHVAGIVRLRDAMTRNIQSGSVTDLPNRKKLTLFV